ncbi:MAG: hypothetical protein NT155_01780 [Candidatus Staskawiczbacteria bacterium]|nr:hypothetical protein [Candidatus Staskawiczbacteria bacterium]
MADNIQEEIEDKVIDCINSGVNGRLVIFKPEKSLFGADLVVEKRGEYKEKGREAHLKINILAGPAKEEILIKDFQQEGFKADKNFYMLFAYFDEVGQKLGNYIWLVPSLQFKDIAEVAQGFLRFEAPLDFKQKSKYSKFLIETKELGHVILSLIEKSSIKV